MGGTSCVGGYLVTPLVSLDYEGEVEDARFYDNNDIGYLLQLEWG
jgi:hypothetical protein